MIELRNPPVIAVDGGGTRCRVAFDDGRRTRIVETGAANVTTDFDGAVREIVAGLNALAEQAGLAPESLAKLPAYVGLAGVIGASIEDRLRAALPLSRLRLADDRPAALRGALGGGDGVLAHCGTGSFFAAQVAGDVRLAGGWGPVLGDEASAQWVGRRALRATLAELDGLTGPSTLAEALLTRHGGAAGIVSFASQAAPREFGALAPEVTRHAEAGDPLAHSLLEDGAREIRAALLGIGWRSDLPICLTGGIGPVYAPYLPAEMQVRLTAALGEPLAGAVALARDFAREATDERR